MKRFLVLIGLCLIAVLSSCGGSVSSSANAVMTITWPERSRLIPLRAESVRVSIAGPAGYTNSQLVTRPAAVASQSTPIQFNSIPAGSYSITAEAFPTPAGSGTVQARGTATATVLANQTSTFDLTMASTVTRVTISPRDEVVLNLPKTLTATAYDSANRVVLVDPTKFEWSALQNCTVNGGTRAAGESVALLSASVGSGSVQASYTEGSEPVFDAWTFSTSSQIGITLSPSSGFLRNGEATRINASVVNATNPSVIWSVTGPAVIDSSAADHAMVRATAASGTITVRAISVQDSTRSTTATFTAQDVIKVTLSPSSGSVSPSVNTTFTAIVANAQNPGVTWQITGATLASSTSSQATVTPGAAGTRYTLTATSVQDPSKTASVTMNVVSGTGGAGGTVRSRGGNR